MEQRMYFSYLEEVNNWARKMEQIVIVHRQEKSLNEEILNLLVRLEEVRENQPITVEGIEEIQQMTEKISNEAKIVSCEIESRKSPNRRVPIGEHVLPPLPYSYNALEPYISEEIMKLHHDTHHKSYVDGLNKAEKMLEKARTTNNYDLLKHWEREAAFHGSGHYLHTIFWFIMKPNGGGTPIGGLLRQIQKDFGSFEQFKEHFTEAAKKVEGVGWAILVWAPRSHRLEILQTEKHQLMTQWDTIPILVLDVWEHAYYLQYKADKDTYIEKWWNVVNWDEVEMRFDEASKLKWVSY
ncbi:superoxide dismutase [Bacillus sp. DJP31]|uniref:superoxide dismutase n=1 Tax=Bacillus sp. DJP31 TaxID=3409789 RepID=UPI003BB4A61C